MKFPNRYLWLKILPTDPTWHGREHRYTQFMLVLKTTLRTWAQLGCDVGFIVQVEMLNVVGYPVTGPSVRLPVS